MRFNAPIFPVIHRADFEVMFISAKAVFNLPQFPIFRNDGHCLERMAAVGDDGMQTIELGILRHCLFIDFSTARTIELQKLRLMLRHESLTGCGFPNLPAEFVQQFSPLFGIVSGARFGVGHDDLALAIGQL